MRFQICSSLSRVEANDWNALISDGDPFLRYEFLRALERHDCVGERTGWHPQHLLGFDQSDRLVAAMPLYLKTNSYGEFVFDWAWADAYQRYGMRYYPKLVSAIPFTPATGARMLLHPAIDPASGRAALAAEAVRLASSLGVSSYHCLFHPTDELAAYEAQSMHRRLGCQYHWRNNRYVNFEDFLAALSSKKRKNIRRERRLVAESGLTLEIVSGSDMNEARWAITHRFYESTFDRRGGFATLTLPFFQEIGETMGDQVVLCLAYDGPREVAGAVCLRSDTTLYGRHWGCDKDYDSLHFEACYYQGIEYCIDNGLQRFEPGAQGEHKVHRGFLPTLTYSSHWIENEGMRRAINDFLEREGPAVKDYAAQLMTHSPYRAPSPA
jgi:predicted N-acyltransferase